MKGEKIPNIVVPTNRSIEHFRKFLEDWQQEFKGCHLIVIEDRPKKILSKLISKYVESFTVYDWKDIDKDLKDKAWIIPRKTDCIRSYGYYKAWQNKPLFIVTLDDDISPQEDHIKTFAKKLFYTTYCDSDFYNTLRGVDTFPRGTYPDIFSNGCDVVHGGWLNVPDLSAEESIKGEYESHISHFNIGLIPRGAYFSMCGMNLAWKPDITKDLYFGLQGGDYPIDRCGDIWAGYNIALKGHKVYNGYPFCNHNKASNVWNNLKKELRAEFMSEEFIDWNKDGRNSEYNVSDELYFNKLKMAYSLWEGLFK